MDELLRAEAKLKEAQARDAEAKAHVAKYRKKKMTYAQVLQEPENIDRLMRDEARQKQVFETLLKRRAKHLISEQDDLFAEYYVDFLKGKVISINDFMFKDKLDPNKELRKRFKPKETKIIKDDKKIR